MKLKLLTGIAAFALVVGASPSARAGQWIGGYSGTNMSQVVVAGSLAFATIVSQFSAYNQSMHAFDALHGINPVDACIAPAFQGSASGLFSGNNHIESMAATTHYTMQAGTAPSDYFEVWVIATNGNTYRTWGTAGCAAAPNDLNVPVPWQLVAGITPYPRNPNGAVLAPVRISLAPNNPPGPGMLAHMVDYYNNEWNLRVFFGPTGVWTTPQYNSTNATMFEFGDNASGTVHRAIGTTDLYAFCAACNADAPVPPLPAGVELAGHSLYGGDFYDVGFTQPVSHSDSDVWAVTTAGSVSNNQNIMRSSLSGGTWSAWQTYPTGQFNNPNDPLPWSIVDASSYRGIRGDVFVIGSNYHLLEYLP